MDELCTWYEVIRSLLPQRYAMRLVWERGAITVTSPRTHRTVWLTERELEGRTPTAVVRAVVERLQTPARSALEPAAR